LGTHTFCSACGEQLTGSPVRKHGWKLLAGLFAILFGIVWGAAVLREPGNDADHAQPQIPPRTETTGATPTATASTASTLELTSAQHLAEARRALAAGNEQNKDPKKGTSSRLLAARWHLEAIGPTAQEYRDAQLLLKDVAKREREVELASKPTTNSSEARTVTQSPPVEDNADDADDEASDTTATTLAPPATRRQTTSSVDDEDEVTVYVTRTGEKYHRGGAAT
jgi:hypothetical protein